MEKNSHTLKEKVYYGFGDIFGGGAFLLISLLFLNYLTDVECLAPALAGTIIMVGKVWDAVWDPLMGTISDRSNTKLGRRRVFFIAGIIPIFITFTMLWYSFGISSKIGLFFYYLIAYLAFNCVFSMVMVPYNSILPDMTKDYKERTSFTGVRMIFSVLSAIAAGVFPKMIVNSYKGNIKLGYLVMGAIFAAVYSLPWIVVFFGTHESKEVEKKSKEGNLFKELSTVFYNRSFKIHAGIFLSGQAAVDFLTTLFIYYLTVCLNLQNQFSAVLGTLLVVQLLVMPIHTKLSKKYTKTTPLRFGLTVWIAALVLSLFLTPSSPKIAVYLIAALSGFGTSAAVLVPWSILPEIADVDEMISAQRREGVYSGMATFLRKIANGFAVAFIGFLLQWIGYVKPSQPGQIVQQSSGTIMGIKILFGIIPIIFIFISMYFSKRYSMTEDKYIILMEEIERRKSGGKAEDVKENSRKVCEELTGQSYNNLWGNLF